MPSRSHGVQGLPWRLIARRNRNRPQPETTREPQRRPQRQQAAWMRSRHRGQRPRPKPPSPPRPRMLRTQPSPRPPSHLPRSVSTDDWESLGERPRRAWPTGWSSPCAHALPFPLRFRPYGRDGSPRGTRTRASRTRRRSCDRELTPAQPTYSAQRAGCRRIDGAHRRRRRRARCSQQARALQA